MGHDDCFFVERWFVPGATELLVILGVAVLIFGPSKLPKLGSALGESIRNFKKGIASQKPEDSQTKLVDKQ